MAFSLRWGLFNFSPSGDSSYILAAIILILYRLSDGQRLCKLFQNKYFNQIEVPPANNVPILRDNHLDQIKGNYITKYTNLQSKSYSLSLRDIQGFKS